MTRNTSMLYAYVHHQLMEGNSPLSFIKMDQATARVDRERVEKPAQVRME